MADNRYDHPAPLVTTRQDGNPAREVITPPPTDGNYWMRKDAPGGADPDSHRQARVPTNRVSACTNTGFGKNATPLPKGVGNRSTTGPF